MRAVHILASLLFCLSTAALAEDLNWFNENSYSGHSIRMLENGEALHAARLELIKSAKRSIYLAAYAIENDGAGAEIADLLCEKAKQGLEVRLMINNRSSKSFTVQSFRLKTCGAVVFHYSAEMINLPFSLHEKLLIADGVRMITGGSGYTDFYNHASRTSHLDKSKLEPWYDLDFEVIGPSSCYFHRKFQWNWIYSGNYGLSSIPDLYTPPNANSSPEFQATHQDKFTPCEPTAIDSSQSISAIPIFNNPLFTKERPILDAHVKAIDASEGSKTSDIKIYSPYFLPPTPYIEALLRARKKGINVTVLTNSPESNDEGFKVSITVGTIKLSKELLAAGVKIYLWANKSTMHRKGAIYGSDLVFFGSDNIDLRSQEYESDNVIFTNDQAINMQMGADFDHDLEGATLMTEEYIRQFNKKAGWFQKLIYNMVGKYF